MNEFNHTVGLISKAPSLCLSAECIGCGDEKRYRRGPASSMVCCNKCWKKIPKWMRDAFVHGFDNNKWENRIAVTLVWMKETA